MVNNGTRGAHRGEVEETLLHLALLGLVMVSVDLDRCAELLKVRSVNTLNQRRRSGTHPRVAMPLKVKDGKAADISEAIDVDRELAEKVDDGPRALGESVPQDEGCHDDREELLEKEGDLHLE